MPPEGFEPAIPASRRPQTHILGRPVTGIRWNRTSPLQFSDLWRACQIHGAKLDNGGIIHVGTLASWWFMRYTQLFDDLGNFVPLLTHRKKIAVLPAENSRVNSFDLTSYAFYSRLLEIHGVCDDTSGIWNSRLSDERNYTENKAQNV